MEMSRSLCLFRKSFISVGLKEEKTVTGLFQIFKERLAHVNGKLRIKISSRAYNQAESLFSWFCLFLHRTILVFLFTIISLDYAL